MEKAVAKISRTAWMDAPETLRVMLALCGGDNDRGDEARFVGGCVRDAVLNVKAFDVDIATVFKPEDVVARLKAAKIKAIPTGIEHGTITAVADQVTFEITTLRHDVETDGRHAVVRFTEEWREDARRRDFTMNALYCNVRGEIYDYFGGLEDAHKGIVRFIDDAELRIQEDYLRILRFYRFAARYAQLDQIDDQARAACAKFAEHLKDISAERIQVEILKLLNANQADALWQMMADDGVLDVILPAAIHVNALKDLMAYERALEIDAYSIRRLAASAGYDQKSARDISAKLKLSNTDRDMLISLCDPAFENMMELDDSGLRRAVYHSHIDMVRNRLLLSAVAQGSDTDLLREKIDFTTKVRLPEFPAQGQDLIDRGISPGQKFGEILKSLEKWWVSEDFKPGRTAVLEKLDSLIS